MTRSIASALTEFKSTVREVLGPDLIEQACEHAGYRWRMRALGPIQTVWMFAMQILHDAACTHATCLLVGVRATDGAYCQARARLPLKVFQILARLVAGRLLESTDELVERWHGHRVFGIDGSSVSMPDVPELDRVFGHPVRQAEGCSFPVASVVGLFRLGSGMLIDMVVNPLYTNEMRASESLLGRLRPNDVLVADRAYSAFVMVYRLCKRGIHIVTRMHQARKVDFRCGTCIGQDDRIVKLPRPTDCPAGMSMKQFRALPASMTVRVIRYRVEVPGYRTREVTLMTTLLDPEAYPLSDVAQLYGDRWEVETCYRHLKQTLHMGILRCKNEDRIRKELLMHSIVYNLVRAIMVQAGIERGQPPDRISLIAVVRYLSQGHVDLDALPSFRVNAARPGRHRQRAVKRRPKPFPLRTRPHHSAPNVSVHKDL